MLLKELFANIDQKLDKLKSKIISCKFPTLLLFCHIFKDRVYKDFLLNDKSFKL